MTEKVKKYLELNAKLQELIAQGDEALSDWCMDELDEIWHSMTEEEIYAVDPNFKKYVMGYMDDQNN